MILMTTQRTKTQRTKTRSKCLCVSQCKPKQWVKQRYLWCSKRLSNWVISSKAKFPALMFLPSLNHMDGLEMIATYQETVSDPLSRLYCCSGRNVFPERSGQGYFASGEKSRCRSRHVYVDHDTRALKDLGDRQSCRMEFLQYFRAFSRGTEEVGLND
jgi:hypothetical protein